MAVDAEIYKNIRGLTDYRNEAWKCVRCGMCRIVNPEKLSSHRWSASCPRGDRFKFEAYYGVGTHEIVRALTTGEPEIEITERLKQIVFSCAACGHCQANCNPMKELEPANAQVALREYIVRETGILPAHLPLVRSIQDYDNPWQQPRAQRPRWSRGIEGIKDLNKEKAEYLFFPGCTACYDPEIRSVAVNTAKILAAAGVDFGILGKTERCCGSTMLRVGARDAFEKYIQPNLETLDSLGVKGILTSCAGCFSTLKGEYDERLGIEIIHTVSFIEALVKEGRIEMRAEVPVRLTFHDPCHTGRYFGIYDAPRNILAALPGAIFEEMERIREYSWCCAAGGGVRTAYPEQALWAAGCRLDEAREVTGADTVVSICPFCEQNLGTAAKQEGEGRPLKVVDLTALLAKAMGV